MAPLILTPTELITEVRAMVQEPNEGFYTDVEILRWLNLATTDIVTRTKVLTSDSHADSVAGQKKYGLPNDFMLVEKVFYQNTELEPFDIHQLLTATDHSGMDLQSSAPEAYYIRGAADSPLCLFLWKVPATSVAAAIHLFYVAKPEAMTLTGTFPLSSEWANAACLYAGARAHRKQRQLSDAADLMKEYNFLVAEAECRRPGGHNIDQPMEINSYETWEHRGRWPRRW